MKTFKQFLAENNRQDLHHGTSLENAHKILRDGHIKPSANGRVSTTRNVRYAREWASFDNHPVTMVIDGNTLRHNHEVKPTDFDHHGGRYDTGRYKESFEPSSGRRSESEESVKGHIPLKHVKELHMKRKDYEGMTSKKKTKSEEDLHKIDPKRTDPFLAGAHYEDRMKEAKEFHSNLKKHGIKLHLHD